MFFAFNLDWDSGRYSQEDMVQDMDELISHLKLPAKDYRYNTGKDTNRFFTAIEKSVRQMVKNDTTLNLNGDLIKKAWFPETSVDIFLSHSHNDLEVVRRIKCILERMGLTVFVDSEVWGCVEDLLKRIDDLYSIKRGNNYDYHKRNQTTAAAYLMLETALTEMMNKAEAIFFLNTRNSALKDSVREGNHVEQIASPWIYHELMTARYLMPYCGDPCRRNEIESMFKKTGIITESFQHIIVRHSVDLSWMHSLSFEKFCKWSDLEINVNDYEFENDLDFNDDDIDLLDDYHSPLDTLYNKYMK